MSYDDCLIMILYTAYIQYKPPTYTDERTTIVFVVSGKVSWLCLAK